MFELLNQHEEIYVDGTGSIPKLTLWYGEDDEVFLYEGSNAYVEKMTVADFNAKLEEIFETAQSRDDYESYRDSLQKIILQELIRNDARTDPHTCSVSDDVDCAAGERSYAFAASLSSDRKYRVAYTFADWLVHDQHPEIAVAYAAKVKNPLGSDDLTLAQATVD
jgi:hypothetical protein